MSCGASLAEPAKAAGRTRGRRGLWLGGGIAAVLAVAVVVVVVLAGGGDGNADGLTGKQRTALDQIREASTGAVQVRVEDGVPRTLGARVPIPDSVGDDPEDKARFFLDAYRDLYELDEPDDTLFLAGVLDTPDDKEVVSFQQRFGGLEVFGADVRVHINSDNEVTYVSSTLPPDGIDVPTEPEISGDDAAAAAVAALGLGAEAEVEVLGSQVLVLNEGLITGERTESVLAVRIDLEVANPPAMPVSFIDATTGKLLFSYDNLQGDRDRKTYTAKKFTNQQFVRVAGRELWITEAGPVAGLNPPPDQEGRSAHRFAGQVYDYFRNTHGRDSYDDKGSTLETYVHLTVPVRDPVTGQIETDPSTGQIREIDNAFWDGQAMWFADGLVTLDVFGHEFTHGVVQHTAGLKYSGQSGALNESFADVFGEFIERDGRWEMGEDLPIGRIRSMRDPGLEGQPDHTTFYDGTSPMAVEDNGGVHINSGIPNRAAHLIVRGGTHDVTNISVTGIGINRAERIYYKALSFLTSTSQFLDARDALLKACLELEQAATDITLKHCSSVINGYAAVGIGSPDADEDAVPDGRDNCGRLGTKLARNPDQKDLNRDGIGDACEPTPEPTSAPAANATSVPAPTPTLVPGSGVAATATAVVGGATPTATTESAASTPDLSWIEDVVQDTIAVLVGGDIPQEVAEVIGDDLRDCLTAAARGGASRSEAIGECQTFFEPPTAGETISASGSFDAPFDRGNQITLSFPSDGGAVVGQVAAGFRFEWCTGGEADFFCDEGEFCITIAELSGQINGSYDGVSVLSGTATATTSETIEAGCEGRTSTPEISVVGWSGTFDGERVRGQLESLEGDEPLPFTAFVVSVSSP